MIRIGHGFDVHAFGGDKPLILGGETIKDHIGLRAHSDGDIVLHATCDALLGAAALGDIASHFPDTDETLSGLDSRKMLTKVFDMITEKGFSINNLDVTVVAQTPRMSPHIQRIRENIAKDLSISVEQVSVKATSTETLGYVGRKEGIAVQAVTLLTTDN
jgi:2-C-methyl-D-erythritol 2,4-cyclodiphosphate synthase